MSTETKKNPALSIALGFALLIVHVLGTIVLAFVGDQTISNVANVFGVLLGTLTLAVAIGFGKKSWIWGIVSFVALFFWNAIMSTIALFADPGLGNLMFGFAIIILCPFAFGLLLYTWPTKTTATEEVKKANAPLESVPTPLMTTSEDAYYRMLERISHKLSFALKGAKLEDPAESAFLLDITSLHLLIEQQIAVLFSAYNEGVIKDDTDAVLPLLVVDEHIEK